MPLLSHYTTLDGLEGIAKKTFWATNFLSLNDTSEAYKQAGKTEITNRRVEQSEG